jgi:2-oxoglutarate dehydrogenase E1 component
VQRWADLDPLKRTERENIPDLEPSFYGFSDADQEAVFDTSNTYFGKDRMSLRELLNALRETYCGTIGRGIHVQHRPGAKALVAAKTGKYSLQA